MRVLVTGATGFIGRHLVSRLIQDPSIEVMGTFLALRKLNPFHGHRIFPRCCDLSDQREVRALFTLFRPDVIVHLAGQSRIRPDDADPVGVTYANVVATHNLLAHCPEGTRFVYASSAAVYGDLPRYFRCDEAAPTEPSSVYGATKVSAEALVKAYTKLGKVSGISLRLVANVGSGATHGVLPDVIRKLRSDSPTLDLLGDEPGSTKPYCHVDDTVEALMRAAFDPKWRGVDVVNVGPEDELSIKELAEVVMNHYALPVRPIKWLGEEANWKGDNRLVRISNRLAYRLGWKPCMASCEAVAAATRRIIEEAA